MAHRDAPVPHRATGFCLGDRGKCLQRLGIPERVQNPDRLLERILRVRPTSDREIDLTRGFRRLGTRIGARPRLDRPSEKTGGD